MTTFFKRIIDDEKSGGIVLILCTLVSMFIANSSLGNNYEHFWTTQLGILSLEQWINDGLMAIFFLMIGLELKREIKIGEFSDPKNAVLPIMAALGGMIVPAIFYASFNFGTASSAGVGIPMATDIAFALGILSLLGKRVPFALKVFLMALAVIDDMGAIIVIAVFYTSHLYLGYLFGAIVIYLILIILNKLKINSLWLYLLLGAVMWYFMLKSGVHATVAGVLLAFVIPFETATDRISPSLYLMKKLHTPVTFLILPIFALANTAVELSTNFSDFIHEPLAKGIMTGLILGKPLGITLACLLAVSLKWAKLPVGTSWSNILGVSFLGGIGFTMSIFISLLAFKNPIFINDAKIAILMSSLISGIIGFLYLYLTLKKENK